MRQSRGRKKNKQLVTLVYLAGNAGWMEVLPYIIGKMWITLTICRKNQKLRICVCVHFYRVPNIS